MNTGEERVSLEEAREQVRKVCVRLGLLHLSFARTLVDELGEEKGKELILKAIKDYGSRIGEEAKEGAKARGFDNDPKYFSSNLPAYGMHDKEVDVEVDGEKRIRGYGCVMGKLWNELGESELGRLYCYVDTSKYMAYNPGYKMIHLKALPDGDEFCELAVRTTTEQERRDFADDDRDWSYIDS
jgi:hypothetical protein